MPLQRVLFAMPLREDRITLKMVAMKIVAMMRVAMMMVVSMMMVAMMTMVSMMMVTMTMPMPMTNVARIESAPNIWDGVHVVMNSKA